MTIAELFQNFPSISWIEYFNKLTSANVTDDETIIVADLNYLTNLNNLLKETPKRVQANYLISKVLQYVDYLSKATIEGKSFISYTYQ